jgi:hypothetical protein
MKTVYSSISSVIITLRNYSRNLKMPYLIPYDSSMNLNFFQRETNQFPFDKMSTNTINLAVDKLKTEIARPAKAGFRDSCRGSIVLWVLWLIVYLVLIALLCLQWLLSLLWLLWSMWLLWLLWLF